MVEQAQREADEPPDPNDDNGEAVGRTGRATPYELAQRRLDVDWEAYRLEVIRLQEARAWTGRKLARESGIPNNTLAAFLRGDTKKPDYVTACALSHTFGYSNPGALLGVPATGRSDVARVAAAHGWVPPPLPGGSGMSGLSGVRLNELVADLLRGVWQARDGREAPPAPPAGAVAEGAAKAAAPWAVGVVVLILPEVAPVVQAVEAVAKAAGK